MKQIAIQDFPQIWLTCTALILFFVVFIAALFWTFRKSANRLYHHLSQLPMEADS